MWFNTRSARNVKTLLDEMETHPHVKKGYGAAVKEP